MAASTLRRGPMGRPSSLRSSSVRMLKRLQIDFLSDEPGRIFTGADTLKPLFDFQQPPPRRYNRVLVESNQAGREFSSRNKTSLGAGTGLADFSIVSDLALATLVSANFEANLALGGCRWSRTPAASFISSGKTAIRMSKVKKPAGSQPPGENTPPRSIQEILGWVEPELDAITGDRIKSNYQQIDRGGPEGCFPIMALAIGSSAGAWPCQASKSQICSAVMKLGLPTSKQPR